MKDIHTLTQMFRHLFDLLSKKQKKNAFIVLLLAILSALFEMLGVSAILPFIQAIIEPEQLIEKRYIQLSVDLFGVHSASQLTMMVAIGIVLIYISKNAFLLFSSYARLKFSTDLTKDLSMLVMDSYMHHPYEHFAVTNSAEILQGINGDSYSIEQIINHITQFITESMVVIAVGIYLFIVDSSMAFGVIVLAGLCAFTITIILKKRTSRMGAINRQSATALNQITVHIANGIKDIFVRQKREEFLNKFKEKEQIYTQTRLQYLFIGTVPERMIETVCITGIVIVVLIRYLFVIDVSDFIASLSVFAVAAFRILPSMSRISGYINGIIFYRPALDIAYKNITAARDYAEQMQNSWNESDEDGNLEFEKEIKVDCITWHYQHSAKNVLSDASLIIQKGESVGIIGESGAGKSTLSDILLGLYVPQIGTVTVDGRAITEMPKSWSRMMGYVPQTVFLMDDTVKANIAFGEDEIDDNRVWQALEQASLKEFVESLSEGLDTIVGEHGIKFSGGQRQRVAIARALYHQPEILILDEATSALDHETEAAVMEAIESLQGKMTMVIIAHRLTTIKNCDKVYEIKSGKALLCDKGKGIG